MTTTNLLPTPQPAPVKEAEFVIDGAVLAATVGIVAKAAYKSGPASAIVLTFRDSRVTVAATDMETAVVIKVPVKGRKGVTIAVDARQMATFAKALSGLQTVTLTTGPEGLTLVSGDLHYFAPIVTEYPIINMLDDEAVTTVLDFPAFARSARICGAAASTDEARPILTGIRFAGGTAVATDSYKLAVDYTAPDLDMLIPAKGALLATRVFDADEEVTWSVNAKGALVLRSDAKALSVRLIEGDYPNWTALVRKGSEYSVAVDRAQLVKSVDKVRVVVNHPMKVEVDATEMHLSVRTDSTFATDKIEMTSGSPDVPTIGLNPDYLSTLLKAIDADVVKLGYESSLKPVLITDAGGDPSWLALVMPVRIPES